ncbi:hypothetical protein LZ31DRAFT_556094 [Colletotrichum somersetense]|nr:hypothetical protein LZ31DRAFT_556094 [Colletotrichum somersetense]
MAFNQTHCYPDSSYYSKLESTSYYAANIGVGNIPYWDLSLLGGDIRLIILSPNEDPTNPMRCSLKQVSLRDTCRYVALSYCWGDNYNT